MPRLTQAERAAVNTDFTGHYTQLLETHPGFEIQPGYGLTQLRAEIADYDERQAAIEAIEATGMPLKRAQRDALFGATSEDVNGIWYFLSLYKGQVRLKLPKSPFTKTVPNIGNVSPGGYDAILRRFGEHWALVNAALAAQTPPAAPLAIGPITLGELEARRAQIHTLEAEVDETVLTRLAVMRAEREQLYGDVREDDREATSLVSRFETYRLEVQSQFAGSPLAATLPRIFPLETAGEVRFDFNYRQNGSDVVAWFEMPSGISASVVYLKEGAFEESVAMPTTAPFKVTFSDVSVEEDVDELELRDAEGKTVAFGRLKRDLIEPLG